MYNKSYVIPGLIILIVVFLLPFWYNTTTGLEDNRPVLQKAEVPIDPETGEKIRGPDDQFIGSEETLSIWRARHMDFVSFYLDFRPKVAQCDNCHKAKFCNDCHEFAGVKLSKAPRDTTDLSQFISVFRSRNVTEGVHHHRWMKDILETEDIKERQCFSCHRDTHCTKCHPLNDPLRAIK